MTKRMARFLAVGTLLIAGTLGAFTVLEAAEGDEQHCCWIFSTGGGHWSQGCCDVGSSCGTTSCGIKPD